MAEKAKIVAVNQFYTFGQDCKPILASNYISCAITVIVTNFCTQESKQLTIEEI